MLTVVAILFTLVLNVGALCRVLCIYLWALPPWHRPSGHLYFSLPEPLGFYKTVGCGKQNKSSCQESNQQANSFDQGVKPTWLFIVGRWPTAMGKN